MSNDVWKCVSLNIAKRNSWLMAGKSGVRCYVVSTTTWPGTTRSVSFFVGSLLDVLLGMMADGTAVRSFQS